MPFQIYANLQYEVYCRSVVLLNVHALSTPNQKLIGESFSITPGAECEFFPNQTGETRYVRIDTGDVTDLNITYEVTAETNPGSRFIRDINSVPIVGLERAALHYLFPSRYCQSDRLGRFASKHFGFIDHPLGQANAICDWVNENIDYLPGSSDVATSARDTLTDRAGVCRDFAHLSIALCRALSIPARYFTGYACHMQPPDFHACFEVCVGNQWFIFDPSRLSSPNGLIRIATGHDAADTSIATIFGSMNLESIQVSCVSETFQSLNRSDLEGKAILLEP